MRTVYETWAKDRPDATYKRIGVHPNPSDAKAALGFGLAALWRAVDNRLIPEGDHLSFISIEQEPDTAEDRVTLALDLIRDYRGIDGAHHKDWLTDQVTRMLTGDGYDTFVAEACAGEDGPDTYSWDEGIAP